MTDEQRFDTLGAVNSAQQGYYTAVLGKQHFGDSLIDQGYDHADIIDLHGPGDWDIEGESETSYMKYLKAAGFTRTSQLSERVNRYSQRWIAETKYHIDDYIGELGKSWLRHQRPEGQPWYCCLSFPGPHMPFDGAGLPQETDYRLEDIDLPLTAESDLVSKPPHFREQLVTGQGNPGGAQANEMTKQELRETRLSYYANMSLIDQKIGEVITLLKATGEYDNTLILFTSDHGEYMGDFGMMGKGQYLSEVLMRVPFIVKPPVSGFTGRTEEAFVSNLDIAATCLSAAGAQVPGNMDSVDLSPFWEPGAEKPVKDTVYLEAGDLRAQRNDTFSCINPEVHTPHLDALIQDSVFFSNARSANPSCVPSRAAIMTGKFPSECQCPSYITQLPADETTFMTRLQEAGYHTAVVGKQHFAGSQIRRGFDDEMIIDGHGAFAENHYIQPYLDFLEQNGIDRKSVYTREFISGGRWNVDTKYHLDDFLGELGKTWLGKKLQEKPDADAKPWFFTLSFSGPHHPYDLEGTKYADRYELDGLLSPDTTYEQLDKKPPQFKGMDSYAKIYLKDFTEEQFKKTKRSYYANITLMDQKIGEVLQMLKDHDMYEDTLIIYTSDHGDFMGDFGMVEKLQCLTDSLMRVPLFVKPPIKGFKGVEIADEVLNIDIAATCLEAAEAQVPEELSGFSYNGYWDHAKEVKVRDAVYMEAGAIKGCIYNGIKTVHYMDRDYGELYDLKQDPKETNNLWDDPSYQQHKLEGTRIILNHMYRAIPKWNIPWNIGTPEI
ncbi:hypothetical protein G195_003892 [Phytophthora kernoviae 00238/432]|uniref:Sulfatase N-terminal domain-containing protein n=1 Tax=Phytophthora kernoviae 00238/432 TaxID=1284355 RepID=A0A8J4SI65_9STRA|nr:hypothetical protein G195_003892 [Phytophthora kernoviae 00238/432]